MVNLVCPQDKLPLTSDLKCPKGHVYRQIDGIYDFLLGEPKNSDVLEKVAPFYEGIYAPLGFLITGRTRYSTILREAGFYSSGEEFLDIGTGPGKIFDYVSCQQCYGLDISLRFLRILKRNRKNVTPIRGDAMSLPFLMSPSLVPLRCSLYICSAIQYRHYLKCREFLRERVDAPLVCSPRTDG